MSDVVEKLQDCIRANDEDGARRIGESLDRQGGMQLMQSVHSLYTQKYGYHNGGNPRLLDAWWDGIGQWLG
jgi:dissimilatory sulfite reductase (desulfoviridin) alpha/beta subunit